MSETARNRLRNALPQMFLAVDSARQIDPSGEVGLAVIIKKLDGSGQLTSFFECDEFFKDIVEVLGYSDMTELVAELVSEEDERQASSKQLEQLDQE